MGRSLLALGLFTLASCVVAQERSASQPHHPPATKPAVPPATQPAPLSSGDAKVDAILDRLETKGRAVKGLVCKLTYKYVTVEPVEDSQTKEGELLFAVDEPNSKFLVHFDKMLAEGVVIDRHEYFLFDGEWLIERNDKARTVIKRQIVRPGERIDPFKLGQGPFPLPFGQKREDILKSFMVTLRPFEVGDPRISDHLHCVPLADTELAAKYTRVEIFVDRKMELPVRIVSERVSDSNRIEVDFREIDAQEAPAKSRFQIDVPADFTATTEPLPEVPKNDGASSRG